MLARIRGEGGTMAESMGRRVACGLLALCLASAVQAQAWTRFGAVEAVAQRDDGVEFASGEAHLRITVPMPGVLRVRLAPQGRFDDTPSWVVVAAAPEVSLAATQGVEAVAPDTVVSTDG